MGLIYKVIHNGYEIGEIAAIWRDMWYLEGTWTPFHTYKSVEFEAALKNYPPASAAQNSEDVPRIVLQNIAVPAERLYCLATGLTGNSLSLRQITSQAALDHFFPSGNI